MSWSVLSDRCRLSTAHRLCGTRANKQPSLKNPILARSGVFGLRAMTTSSAGHPDADPLLKALTKRWASRPSIWVKRTSGKCFFRTVLTISAVGQLLLGPADRLDVIADSIVKLKIK